MSFTRQAGRLAGPNGRHTSRDARADEFFAVLGRAPDAVEAALAMQRSLRKHTWPDGRDVRVRIGLHTGRPTRTPSGYQGLSVNTTSRICTCAHGGQVLLSRSVRAALSDASPYELRSLGSYRLRGISDEHDLYQLVAPELPDGFPPLRIGV